MRRRTFIQQSSALALLSVIPFGCSPVGPASRFSMGLQLYTVRDAMEKDPLQTLKALKEMGYQHFESYGFDAENQTYYGYSPTDLKLILEDLGLKTTSGHYGLASTLSMSESELAYYVDRCIQGAIALGDQYIVFPKLPESYHSAEGYAELVHRLNLMGKQIHEAGLTFAYHNFGFDFDTYDQQTGIEWIIHETNPDWVKLEIDFFWVMHAGVFSPKDLIGMAPGRFPLWHIKDMDKVSRDYTELGNGSIDYSLVLPDPNQAGLKWFYLEQGGNFANSSMESVATSAAFFQKNLKTYL